MSDHSQHRASDPDCDICVAQDAASNAWKNNRMLEARNARLEAVLAAARSARDVLNDPQATGFHHSCAWHGLDEAIAAADQSSAVGEKDGGGDE